MNYLVHQTDFGREFDQKIEELQKLIINIYKVKNEIPKNNNDPIRLHSSTLDATSSFACINAILENRITMGATVKAYENLYSEYLGNTHNVLSCNSGSSANLLSVFASCNPM